MPRESKKQKTVTALLAREFDSKTAQRLVESGHTLNSLKQLTANELSALGIEEVLVQKVLKDSRPPIPAKILEQVLYQSRMVCCICRDSTQGVIVHHIDEFSDSRSHDEANLVVLCLNHHGEAHTERKLQLNLTPKILKEFKKQWIEDVRKYDSEVSKLRATFATESKISLERLDEKPFPIKELLEDQQLLKIFDLVDRSIEDWLKSNYKNSLIERRISLNSYLLVDIIRHDTEPLIRTGYEVGYLYSSSQLEVLGLMLRKKIEALGYALRMKNVHKACLVVVIDESVDFSYLKVARDIGRYIKQEKSHLIPNLDVSIGRIVWRDNPQKILESELTSELTSEVNFPFFESLYQLASSDLESFLKSLESLGFFLDR